MDRIEGKKGDWLTNGAKKILKKNNNKNESATRHDVARDADRTRRRE
jgi:hypothetical protein